MRPWPQPGAPDLTRGRAYASGTFEWGGERLDSVTPETIWSSRPPSENWVAWAHSFAWLPDLVGLEGAAVAHARALVDGWLTVHPERRGPGWGALPTAARALAWCRAAHVLFGEDDPGAPDRLDALSAHVRPLETAIDRIDTALDAWPLLTALAALGHGVPGYEALAEHAHARLADCADTLVAPDGGHLTRAPADTLSVLAAYCALRDVRLAAGLTLDPRVERAIQRGAAMARFFVHADGRLASFHGGGEGVDKDIAAVLTASNAPARAFLVAPHTGYQRMAARDVSVIIDTGAPNLEALRAGLGHASPLALEFASRSGRIFVNCGLTPGQPGRFREPVRATAAHTALVLRDTSSIALDRKTVSRLKKSAGQVSARRNEEDAGVWVDGVQNGYAPRFGLAHRRRVFLNTHGDDLRGEDTVFRPVDAPSGAPRDGASYTVRFHIHPDVEVQPGRDGRSALLTTTGGEAWRFRTDAGGLAVDASVYAARGVAPEESRQLVVAGVSTPDTPLDQAPNRVRWALQRIGRSPAR